ncbi:ribose-phosphate pyrophosphokinase [Solibaculum mannosilyticum]|uniref:ribose-phosphate diphosphokinase n=1 Tax=Solibaculum mannosilyticum TaxID=2780922 RepID=A0A7I8CY83_9FIRM|nr:ribose-phosphate pyrophosphokinase [Solibaculum mannosilyticum]MCO7137605.1 ribose-phosphate pyrophosphokinase [[Clostridium] leptum]BCI59418.1 phosphoribosylpyrophosphate synthetase [Solibaculum mannosilyticum]CZT56145.1 Ribose-phosphate pyrophosphokinase [Eubacteriaceae bacterium CHKCI005]
MPSNIDDFQSIPVGTLGIISMRGCEDMVDKINDYIVQWRQERESEHKSTIAFAGYQRDSYEIKTECCRFGTGEAKGVIKQSVRGHDLFILSDCFNYGCTYKMYGREVPMSPDDHFQDLKRIIAAVGGKARRISVIMPMLYEGRQHKRTSRESLDSAMALKELNNASVANIITFDAHDDRVQNAIPFGGFENVKTAYQMIKAMVNNVPDLKLDPEHMMVISPDEGGMNRCIYYSSVLGLDLGMFYKRRNYSVVINGRNPIVAHEYLGASVEGKDIIIVDDMISSGDSVLDIAARLKYLKARRIFICTSFGLFCEGLERFDEAYQKGLIEKVFTTNLIYRTPELLQRKWYCEVDMSKYIAYIIDTLNHDMSISALLNPSDRIQRLLSRVR